MTTPTEAVAPISSNMEEPLIAVAPPDDEVVAQQVEVLIVDEDEGADEASSASRNSEVNTRTETTHHDSRSRTRTRGSCCGCCGLCPCRFLAVIVGTILFLSAVGKLSWFFSTPAGCLTPKGPVENRKIQVSSPFDQVVSTLPANVYIVQGDVFTLTAESTANVLDELEVQVKNGRQLSLELKTRCFISSREKKPFNIYITMPSLEALEAAGSGDVRAGFTSSNSKDKSIALTGSGNVNVQFGTGKQVNVMKTKLTGSGDLTIKSAGGARDHQVGLFGSGNIHTLDLATERATIKLFGSGNIDVSVSDALEVQLMGSGNVRYKGDPQVHKSGFGSGRVKQLK